MKKYTYVSTLKDGRLTRERVYRDTAWEDQMRSRLEARTKTPWYRAVAAALSEFFWRFS